jgi:hypothetical protein
MVILLADVVLDCREPENLFGEGEYVFPVAGARSWVRSAPDHVRYRLG